VCLDSRLYGPHLLLDSFYYFHSPTLSKSPRFWFCRDYSAELSSLPTFSQLNSPISQLFKIHCYPVILSFIFFLRASASFLFPGCPGPLSSNLQPHAPLYHHQHLDSRGPVLFPAFIWDTNLPWSVIMIIKTLISKSLVHANESCFFTSKWLVLIK